MDRLITLVALRWKLDLRGLLGARERVVGLLLFAPLALLGTAATAAFVFIGVRVLDGSHPEMLQSVLSTVATLAGLFWAASPFLVGVAFSETHDMERLLHFPVPFRTLVASSLTANLMEPMVLVRMPVLVALAVAVAARMVRFPAALLGVLASLAFTLAAAQLVGLLLHGLARNRRWQDRALFVGVAAGFLLSLLPLLFLSGKLGPLVRFVLARDVFTLSPFAWGVRAAVHAGRGETLPFLAFLLGSGGAVLGATALSALLVHRIYRGELSLDGPARGGPGGPTRMPLPGALGALVEKDLRVTWRDPRLKAMIFTGLMGPLILLFFLWPRAGAVSGSTLLLLAWFTGIGAFGSNAFALERRGLLLLLSFPVERGKILVAKNAVALLLRVPSLVLLALATLLMGVPALLAPVLTVALATMLVGAGADNFLSILFPVPAPGPGGNPYGPVSGSRGLGAAAFAAALLVGALALSSPFALLAWLPLRLGVPWLWVPSLILALAGAAAVYMMLVLAAEGLLRRREPDLLARVLAEE